MKVQKICYNKKMLREGKEEIEKGKKRRELKFDSNIESV
jgi:hypothetical protein